MVENDFNKKQGYQYTMCTQKKEIKMSLVLINTDAFFASGPLTHDAPSVRSCVIYNLRSPFLLPTNRAYFFVDQYSG